MANVLKTTIKKMKIRLGEVKSYRIFAPSFESGTLKVKFQT